MEVRLLPMENFILLFSSMSCHLKYFEITNETIPKATLNGGFHFTVSKHAMSSKMF
jgi:hypothetical protein